MPTLYFMNRTSLIFLVLVCLQVVSAMIPNFVYGAVSTVLKQIFGEDVKMAALKIHQKMDKALGKDISIGEVSMMDVGMVRVVEPYLKHAVVSEFIANKAAHNMSFLEPIKSLPEKEKIFQKHPDIKVDFNEVIGIYVVLNESETAACEVLLSAQPCLLSSSDHYFSRMPDPCRAIAKESVSRIIGRFDSIEKLRKSLEKYLKVPAEWDYHWRQIYRRLDVYIGSLSLSKSELEIWERIKTLVTSRAVK